MTPHMLDLVRAIAWHCDIRGPVLDIGSYIESGQEHLDLRRAFPRSATYVGVDIIEGPGVDRHASLLDASQMDAVVTDVTPAITVCLYVMEHVWDMHSSATALARIWQKNPNTWLMVSTHQRQPYHGTPNYPDYWRITAQGMQRLFDDTGIEGTHVIVHPNTSDPTDVLAIRQPANMAWPVEAFVMVVRSVSEHWEQIS